MDLLRTAPLYRQVQVLLEEHERLTTVMADPTTPHGITVSKHGDLNRHNNELALAIHAFVHTPEFLFFTKPYTGLAVETKEAKAARRMHMYLEIKRLAPEFQWFWLIKPEGCTCGCQWDA
jgi:hypothetical protein